MQVKLTLKLKKQTIDRGKAFARKRKTSLSKLIENYLDKVSGETDDAEISPLVKSLSGVIKSSPIDRKKSYGEYLRNKYS